MTSWRTCPWLLKVLDACLVQGCCRLAVWGWGMCPLKGVKRHKNVSMKSENSPLVTVVINLQRLHDVLVRTR